MNVDESEGRRGEDDLVGAVLEFERTARDEGRLAEEVRVRLVAEIGALLCDADRLRGHIQSLRRRLGGVFPPYRLLSRRQIGALLAGGPDTLEDATLARLYRDPVALHDVRDKLLAHRADRASDARR